MAREGQEKVEIRPGAFVWLNEADARAFRARQQQAEPELITSATVNAPENASLNQPAAATTAAPRARAKAGGK